jgi:hypothetical protein
MPFAQWAIRMMMINNIVMKFMKKSREVHTNNNQGLWTVFLNTLSYVIFFCYLPIKIVMLITEPSFGIGVLAKDKITIIMMMISYNR